MTFWKKNKKEARPRQVEGEGGEKKKKETPAEFKNVGTEKDSEISSRNVSASNPRILNAGVLKGFYVSEKASALGALNQYVFKAFGNTTKNEIKKQVEKSFDVKVKSVKIINLPRKARSVGRHSGFKPGFKKAVVALKEGYTIEQAKN